MEKFKLLVLEDDVSMRGALEECLQDEGYDVVSVGRAEEAVTLASEQAFDMIVTDIRMEGMDGLDALAAARKHQPNLTSMVVSGWASEAETLRAIQLNVGAFLRKPFSLDQFLERVRELLDKRVQELRRLSELDQLEKALHWSLDGLARLADEAGVAGQGALTRAGNLAYHLASESQMPPRTCQHMRLAAMLGMLRNHPAATLPELIPEENRVIGPVRKLLDDKLVQLAQQAAASEVPPSSSELGLDGALGELYDRVRTRLETEPQTPPEIWRGLQDPHRVQRSLVALGRSLEDAGDVASAVRAYEECLKRNPESPEAVTSMLGLAGLALRQGRDPKPWIERACEASLAAGPILGARTKLQAGLMLVEPAPAQARPLLESAVGALSGLGTGEGLSRGRLALAHLGEDLPGLEQDVETLLNPGARAEVADSFPWLLPELLKRGSDDVARLRRLITDFSATLAHELGNNKLDRDAREALLGVLEQSAAVPESILQVLQQDPDLGLRSRALKLRQDDRPEAPMLRLNSFGFFQAHVGQNRVPEADWKSQKVKYFLACLGASKKPLAEEYLLETFWPENPTNKRNVYVTLSYLRRALCPGKDTLEWNYVLREGDNLLLNPQHPRWHDLDEFDKAYAKGREAGQAGDAAAEQRWFRQAVELYQGPYLEGYYGDWAVRRRGHLEETAVHCWTRLAHLACQGKQYREALEYSNQALAVDSGRQEAHVTKMRAHLGLGQPEQAIRHFEVSERLLKQEYDVEPTMEFLEMHTRARHGLGDRT